MNKVWHLAARFFTSLSPRPPETDVVDWATAHLDEAEAELWLRQSNQDQRQSAAVARRFAAARPQASRQEIAGALLHDVGKVKSGLGTWGRVVATVVGPRSGRFRLYHDHERIGATMAARAGSDPATVALIRGEGSAAPDLRAADDSI